MLGVRHLALPTTLFIIAISTIALTDRFQQNSDSRSAPVHNTQYPEVVIDGKSIEVRSKESINVSLTRLVPPYYHLGGTYLTAQRYQLASCAIAKNMATIQWSIFCLLKDPIKFAAVKGTITSPHAWNYSLCTTHGAGVRSIMEALGPNMTLFTVIRHPIDRFISGYTDRCLINTRFDADIRCFGCRSDLKCFVETLHKTLISYYHNAIEKTDLIYHLVRHFAPQTCECRTLFNTFFLQQKIGCNLCGRKQQLVRYYFLVRLPHFTIEAPLCSHLWYAIKETQYCEFQKYRNNYKFINYHLGPNGKRKVAEELGAVLMQAKVEPELRTLIVAQLLDGRTPHATHNSMLRRAVERQLMTDKSILRHVIEMYFFDFTNLGFN